MSKLWFCIAAVSIVLVGVGLRLPHLATRSLWADEAQCADNSRGSIAETVMNTRFHNSSPIAYPLLLNIVQKLGSTPIAVRAPSLVSSVLLIILLVLMGRNIIDARAALIAALIVAVTPSQVRYASEVRVYALGCLTAGVMTYAYLSYLACPSGRSQRLGLWASLALAPLIHYGCVLYGVAILFAISWSAIADRTARWREILVAFVCFGATGLFTFLYTVRYQWGAEQWYLKNFMFVLGKTNPAKFLYRNTLSLLTFLTPGDLALGLVALGLASVLVLTSHQATRSIRKLLVCAGSVALLATLCHAYPFGGVRQCLYLAPLVIIAAAIGLQEIVSSLDSTSALRCFAALILIFAVLGVHEIHDQDPYKEIEDSQTILAQLAKSATPEDDVYIFFGARWPVEFYIREEQRQHFIFGLEHRGRPEEYVPELLSLIRPNSNRLFLVFSHINFHEDLRIARDLQSARPGWIVTERVRSTSAALFEAIREPGK